VTRAARLAVPNVNAAPAVRSAFAILDYIQGLPRAEQLAGVAVLFTEACDTLGFDPAQLMDASRRRVAVDLEHGRRDILGLREYLKKEIGR
jgi:hypothetical protein